MWDTYRTTDRFIGYKASFREEGRHYRAKLYWAPADFTKPDEKQRRPYLVVWVSPSGKMNRYGNYEDEVRWAQYVGETKPRRNRSELASLAEKLTKEKLTELAGNALWYHEQMLSHGCSYANGVYYYPTGSDHMAINQAVKAAWEAREGSVA